MPLSEAREAHLARLFAPDSTFPTDAPDDAPDDADGTNAGDAFDDFFRRTRGAALVVDTNVLLDLYYWKDPRSVELREAIEAGRLVPVRDRASVRELAEVLDRPRFGLEFDAVSAILEAWCQRALPVPEVLVEEAGRKLREKRILCRDPLDQKFLDLAAAARALGLVTKDKLVLRAGKKLARLGVKTTLPEDVAAILERAPKTF